MASERKGNPPLSTFERPIPKKADLRFAIVDGPPELDFLFAFARRVPIELTLMSPDGYGIKKDITVFIDVLALPPSERVYNKEPDPHWHIDGRFWGNGEDSWSTFEHGKDKKDEYWLWGKFHGAYNKKTRGGVVITYNWDDRKHS